MQSFEVQVWSASLADVSVRDWADLHGLLDPVEQARAGRLRFSVDRDTYVLAHALRRLAIAEQFGLPPESLEFGEDSNGKPHLAMPVADGPKPVFFSHSHARGQVAFAMSRDGPIGIDLEAMAPGADCALLDGFMQKTEGPHPPGFRGTDSFYFYWTAIEAFWKADGRGLAASNPKLACRLNEAGWHEITVADGLGNRPSACVLPLGTAPGHALSLAVRYANAPAANAPAKHTARIGIGEKTHFFGCKRRLLRGSLTTIVSS